MCDLWLRYGVPEEMLPNTRSKFSRGGHNEELYIYSSTSDTIADGVRFSTQ